MEYDVWRDAGKSLVNQRRVERHRTASETVFPQTNAGLLGLAPVCPYASLPWHFSYFLPTARGPELRLGAIRESVAAFQTAGLTWSLSLRAPELGVRQTKDGVVYRLYKQSGNKLADTPEITVVYSFDDELAYVHDRRPNLDATRTNLRFRIFAWLKSRSLKKASVVCH